MAPELGSESRIPSMLEAYELVFDAQGVRIDLPHLFLVSRPYAKTAFFNHGFTIQIIILIHYAYFHSKHFITVSTSNSFKKTHFSHFYSVILVIVRMLE